MGIIDPHELDARKVASFEGFEIGLPVTFLAEVVGQDTGFRQPGGRGVGRIARVRHEHAVARVEEGQGDEQDALFRAHQRLDFARGVQADAIVTAVPGCERFPQGVEADIALVGVDIGPPCAFRQGVYGGLGRHSVGGADAQVDDGGQAGFRIAAVDGGNLLELAGKIVFLDCFGPFGGLDDHKAE